MNGPYLLLYTYYYVFLLTFPFWTSGRHSGKRKFKDIQVWSPVLQKAVPVAQVVSSFETLWENTIVRSRNRMQTIIASCNPTGELATPLFNRLRAQIEAMELPPGYALSWGGEYEDSTKAQAGLAGALPGGFLLMILTSILLFGKVRQPLIIWLTVPLAVVGITAGLLGFNGEDDGEAEYLLVVAPTPRPVPADSWLPDLETFLAPPPYVRGPVAEAGKVVATAVMVWGDEPSDPTQPREGEDEPEEGAGDDEPDVGVKEVGGQDDPNPEANRGD